MTHLDEAIDTTESTTPSSDHPSRDNDRRAMLRKLAIGGAGAAVAVTALGRTAQAADGDALELGDGATTNTSTTPTTLVHTPAGAVTEGASALSVAGAAVPADAPLPANVGGYGNDLVANGVHGSTTAAEGFGVVAANLAPAAASDTDPVPVGLAIASSGGAQLLFLASDDAVTGPTPGKHVAGELYADKDGALWFTVPTATADVVRFVQLAGASGAGSYHAIDPQRAYDSRLAAYTPNGLLEPNASRVVSVADGHSADGSVTLANAVPIGATAVVINLTAASPTAANYLSVARGDATATATSALNWDLGVTQIANSITVPVSADRELKVFCGDQAGSTHFIVDVFGYYL